MSKTAKVILIVGGIAFALIFVAVIALALIFQSAGTPSVPDNSVVVLRVSGEKETVVRPKVATADWTPGRKTEDAAGPSEPKKSGVFLPILLTALAMTLLFGGIALGWFLLRDGDSKNKNIAVLSPTKTASRTSTPTPPKTPEWTIDYNSSLNGERITYYPGTTVAACQTDCANNPRCVAFTLIRAGAYNPPDPPMCYLMSKVTSPASHACCISGIKAGTDTGGKTDGPPPP